MTESAALTPDAETPEAPPAPAAPPPPPGPGAMLRAAREARGLSLEALAGQLKVQVGRLESLEADRLEELHDLTFARALTQSVCRVLKVDAAAALALLPSLPSRGIEAIAEGLDQPFRAPAATRLAGLPGWRIPATPWTGLALLLGLAAALLAFGPVEWTGLARRALPTGPAEAPAPAPALASPSPLPPQAAAGGGMAAMPASTPTPAGPALAAADPVPSPASAAGPSAGLRMRLAGAAESWIEVRDARGKLLLATMLRPGQEVAELEAEGPLRLVVGHAPSTVLSWAGQPVDLAPHTKGHVARLELK